ncbi:MAG: oxidoreductase, Gfo/Idh/MocA family [Modestobacter sp.]|nr:oxidoreductase, Gfo/Idh/MocA family [Modestobacter sp.]
MRRDPAAPLRIGLVGFGKGGRYFHAPLIDQAEGCELGGVVVRSAARRAELAAGRPGLPVHGSLAELAAAGVDAVVVTTPLDSHVALVREAVGLGLPVVCDKPFAPDADTARETVRFAEHAGVPLTVYQNRRWDADFRTVLDVVQGGELGEVVAVESRMEQSPPDGGVPTSGGGVRLDLGSHAVDQLRCLLGPVESVYAECRVLPGRGLDDRFFAALRHRSGVWSHLTCTLTHQGEPGARFRVVGTAATLVVEDDDGQTDRLLAGRTPADEGAAWGTVPESRWGRVHRGGAATPVPSATGSWSSFYTGLAGALRDRTPLPVDPADAVATLEVLDAARLSARTGQVVRLPEGAG